MLLWRALAWSSGEGVGGPVVLLRVSVRLILGLRPDASGGVLRGKSGDNLISFVLEELVDFRCFAELGVLRESK